MAFFELNFNPDLKITNRLLGRIAHVLERIATEHLGIELKETPEPDESVVQVSYTDDTEELRKEFEKELGLPSEETDVQR